MSHYPPAPPAPLSSPLRRQRVTQPPTLLTTSLANNAHSLGLSAPGHNGQTPISTTSLSSPFSTHSNSPYPSSPATGSSPMSLRGPTSFVAAAPYNPQQWGPISSDESPGPGHPPVMGSVHGRQQSRPMYAPRMQGPDEPMGSPPPPYSADSTPSSSDARSPGTDFSMNNTPVSASTTMSPGGATITIGIDPRSSNAHTPGPTSFPPPPPLGGRARSTSRNHADRLLTGLGLRSRNNDHSSSPTAMESLQQNTQHLLSIQSNVDARPPAARRAASTGAIGTSMYHRAPPQEPRVEQREYGMPLPPPPPGPPPGASRSQSLNRPIETSRTLPVPRTRQPPGLGTALGPVPPTPADWRDEDQGSSSTQRPERPPWQQPLHIQTDNLVESQLTESPVSVQPVERVRQESAGSLVRSPAVRNRSAKGLRERRSESKMGRRRLSGEPQSPDSATEALARPLADIDVNAGSISQRRASNRMTPRSGKNFLGLDEALTSGGSAGPLSGLRSGSAITIGSGLTTPQVDGQFSETTSPAFSPGRDAGSRASHERPISRNATYPPSRPGSAQNVYSQNQRPVSHILHTPNEENMRIMPLSPESTHSLMDFEPENPNRFAGKSLERHRLFLQKEANATSDSQRLQLFVEYMLGESRIRREKYNKVFIAERINPTDLVEGMFAEVEPPRPAREQVEPPLQTARPESAQDSRRSSGTSFADSHSQSQNHSRPASTSATSDHAQLTLDTSIGESRGKNFVPCLSPIQSMSAVTGRDETESRGRAPSRWWETSSNPSQGDGFDVLKRSKRESKYMSALIEDTISPVEPAQGSSSQLPSYENLGPNEYPPEKVGWHEQHVTLPPHRQGSMRTPMSAPFTPDPKKLDISRLITLPPPYPRRHPAVNNSHPDLADIRGIVRSLHEFPEATEANARFEDKAAERRKRADSWTKHQKSLHNQDVQFRIEQGSMTQAEYDEAEAALEAKLEGARRDLAQGTFDLFQAEVTKDIHPEYDARIGRATEAFNALSGRLVSDSDTHSPNLAQEGGDERPELLEKLTMLKWLFEAREALHRAQHDLLTVRNEHYEAIVTLPYLQQQQRAGKNNNSRRTAAAASGDASSSSSSSADQKLAETRAFFAQDKRRRQAEADKASLARWRDFAAIIDTHVTRGVEVQLSAFWDIAPPLQSLLQRVPDPGRLAAAGFEILIPKQEVDENPVYWEHPIRYLYSVLSHAEASSRQFVEAQVSLWCLLQEVREGAIGARWRAKLSRRAEEVGESGGGYVGEEEMGLDWREEREKGEEIQRGVDELKEKVGVVEEQWVEGLGGEIGRVREAARALLEGTGGWDEELEEGAE